MEIACSHPQPICAAWNTQCLQYTVNYKLEQHHENPFPRWREFNTAQGERPDQYTNQIVLKFSSPNRVVKDCDLSRFGRTFGQDGTQEIRIPLVSDHFVCGDGQELWTAENSESSDQLPQLYIKNNARTNTQKPCGISESVRQANHISTIQSRLIVPDNLRSILEVRSGPVPGSCRHENPIFMGQVPHFNERAPLKFSGTIQVLGRVMETLMNDIRGESP